MLLTGKDKNAHESIHKLLIHVEELLKVRQCAPIHIYQRLKREKHLGMHSKRMGPVLLGEVRDQDDKQRAETDAQAAPPGHEEELICCACD